MMEIEIYLKRITLCNGGDCHISKIPPNKWEFTMELRPLGIAPLRPMLVRSKRTKALSKLKVKIGSMGIPVHSCSDN